ncbi:MAG: hypothetical protein ACHQ4H_01055 [Ktedonobacterales bacterium]
MARTLHMATSSSLDMVRQALADTRARVIALVFPPQATIPLAEIEALHALHSFCRARDKDVTIIGGNEQLRAAAVASGFVAATSLDAWEPVERERPTAFAPDAWIEADVALAGAPRRDDGYETLNADPPEYVLCLLRAEGSYTGPRAEATAQEVAALRDELAVTDPLLRAHQRHEERITTAIRSTGRLVGAVWPLTSASSCVQTPVETNIG